MLLLKDLVSYEDREVDENGEGLNQFDPPPIFNDHGDKEILGLEGYGDEELFKFKDLREPLVPLSFCEEEKLAHKEEFHASPYKATCLYQEHQIEVIRDFYSLSFLVFS